MSYIEPFAKIGKDDTARAGGKGASLGEMTQAGIQVPPGFVVLAGAFEEFIEKTDLNVEIDAALSAVKHEDIHTVEQASGKIQALIMAASMPDDIAVDIMKHFKELGAPFVAVRSSATAEDSASAAWAGQLDTYLNTTADELLINVQRCFASLFTPRAIFYRFEKGLHTTKISVAVVVQKMVASECSGIAFSVHPVTEDRNQLVIEASWGLGEAIVSGQVTPDSYVVTKEPREIIDTHIATKQRGMYRKEGGRNEWQNIPKERQEVQTLSDEQILALSETVISIEHHYGFPCDIEWAMEDDTIYITQSRPILASSVVPTFPIETDMLEYELTFEGNGITVLYESVLLTNYMPYASVSFIVQGYAREYVSCDALRQMSEEGCTRTYEEVIRAKTAMEQAISQAEEFRTNAFVQAFSKGVALQALDHAGTLAACYGYFDTYYWESAFVHAAQNKKLQKIITAVESYRNIACEAYDQVFFGTGYVSELLHYLGRGTRTVPDDLARYTVQELKACVETGYRLTDDEIVARKELSVIVRDIHGVLHLYSGTYARRYLYAFQNRKVNIEAFDNLVRGKVAHSTGGLVYGPACILTRDYGASHEERHEHSNTVSQGGIVISQTVDPSMTSMLRRAGAIVTDLGGMLSHGAIVAREFGIPCIISTGVATCSFKNGDMLEVDTHNGTVRKI